MASTTSAIRPPGCRLGPWEFASGVSAVNAWRWRDACLAKMPVISLLSFSRPYVLTGIIGIPPERHGQVTGLPGRETPLDVRGSGIGLAGCCGSLGIRMTSLAGGYLFG